jgi:hypothetical protein
VVVHVGNASGEKKYGDSRTAIWLANTYRFYRRHHGVAGTAAYRAANAIGAGIACIRALVRRDRDVARHWASTMPLHFRSARRRRG